MSGSGTGWHLWIGTEGGGVLHYGHGSFQAFGQKEGLTNGFIRTIHSRAKNNLLVGTDRGIFQLSGGKFKRLDGTPAIPLASVVSIAEDASRKIWIASSAGLLTFDRNQLVRASCPNFQRDPAQTVSLLHEKLISDGCERLSVPLPDVQISALHQSRSGVLWVGTTSEGLLAVDSSTGEHTTYLAPSVLPDNAVLALFEDRQKNIWVGVQDGLLRLSRAVVTTLSTSDGLQDDNITTIFEDRRKTLWITTSSGQVYQFDGIKLARYRLPQPAQELRVRTTFEDRSGTYWFGSTAGVAQVVNGRVRVLTKDDGLRSNSIRQVFQDRAGMIWLATGSGLSKWNGRSFENFYLEEGLSYPSVRCIAQDVDGNILVGTDAGLNKIVGSKIVAAPEFASFKQKKIWSILPDGKNLWLGTRGDGLVLLHRDHSTQWTTQNGLLSDTIYQIVDDHAGKLWMSSPVGVFSVLHKELEDGANNSVGPVHAVAYGTSEGMITSQMNGGHQPAGIQTASGDLWFPSLRGAVKVDPNRSPERQTAPVVIERISAGDVVLPLSDQVTIPAGREKIQIDFTASDLTAPQEIRFRYKLEGFDDSWTTTTRLRSAYYSNLPARRYRFRVIAENIAGPTLASEASTSIVRVPQFYETGWFYAALAALIIGSIYLGFWIYAKQTRARFALLLSERTRLAREMHDTVIQGCVGVSTLLEALSRSQRTNLPESSGLLDQARAQVKATLEEARIAVWDLRNSNDEQSSISSLFDLALRLGAENGARVDTEIQGDRVPLHPATERTLLLVGREALRNSVAHGKPTRIGVCVSFDRNTVRMEIRDNGVGFDFGSYALGANGHFGIIGMQERVEQLGGEFSLQSKEGQGTDVRVALPTATTLNPLATLRDATP